MSYKVLARKWRPQHFRDLLGQDAVVRALSNALDSDRLHHAYLFTGMRGVGKTTIARIFAKCLNCETQGVSANPCGECGACKDIEAGRFFDLIEVDAASRTKVEGTRELLENVPYAPASGRYKVYLIDEVHMFSTHSFNALLKTLEEPPEHVKFLLATTDPQKVPVTVLSRCLQFNLKSMSSGSLVDYLQTILKEESIDNDLPALGLIARAAQGSVRDALSLVEQATAFGEGRIALEHVEDMLGRVSSDRLISLIETLADDDMPSLFAQVDAMAQFAPDFHELLGEILSLLHQAALLQAVPDGVPETTPGIDRLNALSGRVANDTLQLYYQIGLHARRDMPFAPDQREAFDMALLRMHAFRPESNDVVTGKVADTPVHAAGVDQGTNLSNEPKVGGLAVRGEVSAGAATKIEPKRQVDASPRSAAVAHSIEIVDQPVKQNTQAPESPTATIDSAAKAPRPQMQHTGVETAPKGPTNGTLNANDWPRVVSQLDIAGMPLQLASNCSLLEVSEQMVRLKLERSSEHLNSQRFVDRVQAALSQWLGRDINLSLDIVDEQLSTPASLSEQKLAEDIAAAHESIKEDPIVQQLIDKVDGSVDESSVRPIRGS